MLLQAISNRLSLSLDVENPARLQGMLKVHADALLLQDIDLHAARKHRHCHRHTRKLRSAATLWFDLMLM